MTHHPHTTAPAPPESEISQDNFLDGTFSVLQPRRGHHRAGLDALLLAAAVPPGATGHLVDLGAGVGVAGLAALARAPGLTLTLVERDPVVAGLARAGLGLPANATLAARARVVEADVTAPEADRRAAGLAPASADWVVTNPPFYAEGAVRGSPADARRAAHVLPAGGLERWLRTAVWLLKPGGRIAVVFRGDAQGELLAALTGRFGAVTLHPVAPRAGHPAHRIIATGIKGSRAAAAVMPGLILHPPTGNTYLPDADALLRGRGGLPAGRV